MPQKRSLGRSGFSSKAKPTKTFNLDDDDSDDDLIVDSQEERRAPSKSSSSRGLSCSSKGSTTNNQRSSPIVGFLARNGILLKFGEQPDELTVDVSNATKKLENAFELQSAQFKLDFEKFFREYFEDRKCLKTALAPFDVPKGDVTSSWNTVGLVRLLLLVTGIQTSLFEYLLETAIKLGDESSKSSQGGVNWVQRILSRFQNLPQLVNSDKICDRLLDLLETQPTEIIKLVIGNLVGIVADTQHERVAERLMTLMRQKVELKKIILETLANLTLEPPMLVKYKNQLINTLSSCEPSVVPELVHFVLTDLSPADAKLFIPRVREKLDLYQGGSADGNDRGDGKTSMSLLTYHLSVFITNEAMAKAWKAAIEKGKTWKPSDLVILLLFQSMDSLRGKPVMTLLKSKICAGVFTPKVIDSLLADAPEIVEAHLSEYLRIASSLMLMGEVPCVTFGSEMHVKGFRAVKPFFRQEILDSLIRMVGNWTADTAGGRCPPALDALAILVRYHLDLVSEQSYRLGMFLELVNNRPLPQVRVLLDVFATVACYMSQDGLGKSCTTQKMKSELMILVRKQLGLSSPLLKKIGVVGAVMLLKALSNQSEPANPTRPLSLAGESGASSVMSESESSETLLARDPGFGEAKALLQLALDETENSPAALALLYDQLSTVLNCDGLASGLTLEKYFWSKMYAAFSCGRRNETYVQVLSRLEENSACEWFEMKLLFDMESSNDEVDEDGVDPEGLFLNLGPLVYEEAKDGLRHDFRDSVSQLYALLPKFRLLAACERNKNKKLEGIFSLLEIGLLVPDVIAGRNQRRAGAQDWDWDWEALDPMAQKTVLRTYFLAANWFIELISAFAGDIEHDDPDVLHEVVHRLRHVIFIRKFLAQVLKESSDIDFVPPPARFEIDHPRSFQPKFITGTAAQSGGRRGRKRKAGADTTSAERTLVRGTQQTPRTQAGAEDESSDDVAVSRAGGDASAILSQYAVFFREVDLAAFKIFQAPLDLDQDFKDTLHISKVPGLQEGVTKIGLEEAEFLITDLAAKLDFVFLATSKKRFGAPSGSSESDVPNSIIHHNLSLVKTRDVAKLVSSIVGFLAGYLKVLGVYFQSIIDAHDGVEDSTDMFDEKSRKVGRLLRLILRCFRAFFSWPNFHQGTEDRPILEESLRSISDRLLDTGGNVILDSQVSLTALVKSAFDSLRTLSSCTIDLGTAVELLQLLESIAKFAKNAPGTPVASGRARTVSKAPQAAIADQQLIDRLVESAEFFLKKSWCSGTGKMTPSDCTKLTQILKLYLTYVGEMEDIWGRLKILDGLIRTSFRRALDETENDVHYKDDTFSSLCKQTLVAYHQAALIALLAVAKDISYALDDPSQDEGEMFDVSASEQEVNDWRRRPGDSEPVNQLRLWRVTLGLFEVLCRQTLEKSTTRGFIVNAVKVGAMFLAELSKSGLPIMESLFSSRRNEVLELITAIQKNHTRIFQRVCAQTKKDKDVGIGKFIPALRKSLETFVFRVKGMMAANACQAAFKLANLKNKNVRGEELASLLDPESDAEEEEEEEEEEDEELVDTDENAGAVEDDGNEDEEPMDED